MTTDLESILRSGPVIPVVTLADAALGPPLADALVAGGIRTIEVTLRTPAALAAIRRIRAESPDTLVGAGTVWTNADADAALDAGAQFIVSPGTPAGMIERLGGLGVPYLPGVQTATEAAAAVAAGARAVKFFPAVPAGGVAALRALAAVFPDLFFCPTGGITAETAPAFLALERVVCLGGSWLAPGAVLRAGTWDDITALAEQAAGLGK